MNKWQNKLSITFYSGGTIHNVHQKAENRRIRWNRKIWFRLVSSVNGQCWNDTEWQAAIVIHVNVTHIKMENIKTEDCVGLCTAVGQSPSPRAWPAGLACGLGCTPALCVTHSAVEAAYVVLCKWTLIITLTLSRLQWSCGSTLVCSTRGPRIESVLQTSFYAFWNHRDTQLSERAAHVLQCLGWLSLPPSEGQ